MYQQCTTSVQYCLLYNITTAHNTSTVLSAAECHVTTATYTYTVQQPQNTAMYKLWPLHCRCAAVNMQTDCSHRHTNIWS